MYNRFCHTFSTHVMMLSHSKKFRTTHLRTATCVLGQSTNSNSDFLTFRQASDT
jgi:hypothetical protein